MTVGARVAIVGTGRVARAFGRLLADSGDPPVAVAGRSIDHAAQAASFVGPSVKAVVIRDLAPLADRILIAVSDDAIPTVARELAESGLRGGVVLHTSGAHGPRLLDALSGQGVSCGVLHPLQTIADGERGPAALRGSSFGIGGDRAAVEWAEHLVSLAGGTALRIRDNGFASYHAGAVMASNAVIAAIDAAVVLLGASGVDRPAALKALRPLCLTSARNTFDLGPEAALTGPVQRGDAETIRTHAAALAGAPQAVADLYRASARVLLDIATRRGLSADAARSVEIALEG